MEKEDNFKTIISLDSELNQIQDPDILMDRILLEARKIVRADAGSIYIKEKAPGKGSRGENLIIKYSQNDTLQGELEPGQKLITANFLVPIDEKTISGYCALSKRPVNVPDVYNISKDASYSYSAAYDLISGYQTSSILSIPLLTVEGRLLGVIQVINSLDKDGNAVPFSADDELYISHFATNATLALQRAYLSQAMLLRMIKMSELRDPKETGAHVNRVAGYAVEIYDCWAFHHKVEQRERDRYRDSLKIAAMLHDVGKVAISDVILKKPARFTDEEYKIMQNHTIYGAGLFDDDQSEMDKLARDIALNHHENWDGSGYPNGRRGEEIPYAARIVAIADVFDALSSRRVYKDPWTEEDVLKTIRQMAGTKFDSELVDFFFEILPNIKQIQQLYPEAVEPS